MLIDLLGHYVPVSVLCERWSLSPACLYNWQQAFMLYGMGSLGYGIMYCSSAEMIVVATSSPASSSFRCKAAP